MPARAIATAPAPIPGRLLAVEYDSWMDTQYRVVFRVVDDVPGSRETVEAQGTPVAAYRRYRWVRWCDDVHDERHDRRVDDPTYDPQCEDIDSVYFGEDGEPIAKRERLSATLPLTDEERRQLKAVAVLRRGR